MFYVNNIKFWALVMTYQHEQYHRRLTQIPYIKAMVKRGFLISIKLY